MNRRHIGAAAGLVGALVLGVAIQGRNPDAPTPQTPPVETGPVLRVGAIVGETTATERAVRRGLTVAAEALNSSRGAKPAVELVLLDAAGSGETARSHLDQLHAQGVRLIVDIVGDELLEASAKWIRGHEDVVVATTNGAPRLRGLGGERFVRVAHWNGEAGRELAEWARALRAKRVCVLHDLTPSSLAHREALARALGDVAAQPIEVTDAKAQASWVVEQLGTLKPDVLVCFLEPAATVVVLEAVQKDGPAHVLCVGPEVSKVLGGSTAKGSLPRLGFVTPDPQGTPERRDVVLAALRRLDADATQDEVALAAHDALQILVRAAWSEGGDTPRTVRALLGSRFEGASGPVAFAGGERIPPPWRRLVCTAEGALVPWSAVGP